MEGVDLLRKIDRAVLVIVSVVLILSGIYLAGPWYIPVVAGTEAPLYSLLATDGYITTFGIVQAAVGVGLAICALLTSVPRGVLSTIVFTAFAVRLYSTIGVYIALNGKFLPPSYLYQTAIVAILGAYWLFVKKRESK